MYSLFHKLSAQADAGSAQLSQQSEGDSGKGYRSLALNLLLRKCLLLDNNPTLAVLQ